VGVSAGAPTQPEPTRPGPPPAGTDADDTPAPLLPTTIADDRYRVEAQLGVGGMGVVVRACDDVLGREVAVKLLADNLALDAGSRARFLHEARAAAAVADPRVVAVYDVGEEGGRPYLVMEWVDGPSLADELAERGPLPAEEVQHVASDALSALSSAHEAGLLHRDVKPGNLLRAPDGTTKVTDFGVAVAVDGERLTRTGFVIGTAGYLAPERRRGEPASIRTDLWALGATLTELLTGHAPGATATALLRSRDDVPPRLRELLRGLLADHPDDRPDDALAALELLALDPERSGAPTPPPPTATATRSSSDDADPTEPVSPRQLVRVGALAAVVVAGLLVTTVVGASGSVEDDPGFVPVVVDPEDPASTARELAERLRDHTS
jgi:eukaryotic-like serine/threonine-protein kinase